MGLSVTASVLAPGRLLPAWGQPDGVLLEEVALRPGGRGDLSEGAQQEAAPAPGQTVGLDLPPGRAYSPAGEGESLARELPEAGPLPTPLRGGERWGQALRLNKEHSHRRGHAPRATRSPGCSQPTTELHPRRSRACRHHKAFKGDGRAVRPLRPGRGLCSVCCWSGAASIPGGALHRLAGTQGPRLLRPPLSLVRQGRHGLRSPTQRPGHLSEGPGPRRQTPFLAQRRGERAGPPVLDTSAGLFSLPLSAIMRRPVLK